MTYQSPAATDAQHIRNQSKSPINTVTARRYCKGSRCRNGSGQWRSIQQFTNSAGEAVFKYCSLCRGAA